MPIRIQDTPIDANALLASVQSPEHGAQLLFVGTVRNLNEGRPVVGIHYQAYREMAERVLQEIAQEAEGNCPGCRIGVVHRTGEIEVGEASVAIAVSSPHRAESFELSRYIIEEIKKRLPVWKQERYADGATEWQAGIDPATGAGYHG